MQQRHFFALLAAPVLFFSALHADSWDRVQLPHKFVLPLTFEEKTYSTQLPTAPLSWIHTSECNTYQPPSIHWKSDLIPQVKGISFKGLVFKQPELKDLGDPLNSFAIFFHEFECYANGSEYGWVFTESDLPNARFYLCFNCNITNIQKWATWPAEKSAFEVLEGDEKGVKKALEKSGVYRYWNIKLTQDGDFSLQLINPNNYKSVSVTLKKPSWYPNLYGKEGHITIKAKKEGEQNLLTPPYMHVDDVKAWQ